MVSPHLYSINLQKGDFIHIVIEAKTADLVITLYGPDREAVASVENPNTRSGIEPLFWVANLSGEHIVEVRGQDAGMRPGKYSISIEAPRESTSQDRDRVAAQTAYSYAYSVSRRTLEEAQLNCLPLLEQTAQQWKNLREIEREEENQRDIAKVRRNLGIIYEGGHGVPANREKSVKWFQSSLPWYRNAAEQGDAEAQTVMGDFYLAGRGVEQNYAQALKWYRKAAVAGYGRAENNLGYIYFMGLGVKRDDRGAMKYFNAAAGHENAVAMKNLGTLYRDGLGTSKNETVAREWFQKAAEHGDREARQILSP